MDEQSYQRHQNTHDLVLVSVLRKNEVIYPKGETILQKGDEVMVVSNLETIEVLRKHV